MAGNTNDISTYEELCLPNEKKFKQERAKEIVKPAQKGEPVNNEILIASLNLADIDFNDPKNVLVLINLLNNDRFFRNTLFNLTSKRPYTSTRPVINIDNISDDLFKAAFGLEKFNVYTKDKEKWRKNPANQADINQVIENINGNVQQFILRSTQELTKQIEEKLETDIEFGYNLFARWDIPDGQRTLPAKTLKKWALQNAGAALGILINPKLSAKLLPTLSDQEKSKLLHNAELISSNPTEYPKQQHYGDVTSTLLEKKESTTVNTAEQVVASFMSSDDIDKSLQTGTEALDNYLAKDRNDVKLSDAKPTTTYHNAISKKTGTIISLFADKFSGNSGKDSALTTLVTKLQPNINTLIKLYSSQREPTQKAALKHQVDLLFSNPAISQKLNISEDALATLASNKTSLPNELVQYRHKLEQYTRLSTTKTVSDEAAFIIANRPALWKQIDPAELHPIKYKLNEWFGWFEDEIGREKARLATLSPIFKQRLEGETIQTQLNYIQDSRAPNKLNGSPLKVQKTLNDNPVKTFETPQKPQSQVPTFGTPEVPTFETPQKPQQITSVPTFGTPQKPQQITSVPTFGTPQ